MNNHSTLLTCKYPDFENAVSLLELQHQIILNHAWKMWTLQISLNSLDLKNMDTPSQSIFVTHLNNSNVENADTLIWSTPWQKSGTSESTFQNVCTVQTWQMCTL